MEFLLKSAVLAVRAGRPTAADGSVQGAEPAT
jgi:hypothetical protein